jgi:hypothetical protein
VPWDGVFRYGKSRFLDEDVKLVGMSIFSLMTDVSVICVHTVLRLLNSLENLGFKATDFQDWVIVIEIQDRLPRKQVQLHVVRSIQVGRSF